MIYEISNNIYTLKVDSLGAELISASYKKEEYLHQKEKVFWNRSSPVLFPIVGKLKNNNYKYNNKNYSLPIHGLARHKEFTFTKQDKNTLVFSLKEDKESLKHYPFPFSLQITYTLKEDSFDINYQLSSHEDILFSLGAHPAFILKAEIDESYLEFEEKENLDLLCLNLENGCISKTKKDYLNSKILQLEKNIFEKDALIFENIKSKKVSLKNSKNSKSVSVTYEGFPFIGFWAPMNADFVCLEPWCGIADDDNTNYIFKDKKGIISLKKNDIFSRTLGISFN